MSKYITFKELASEINRDQSHVAKLVKKLVKNKRLKVISTLHNNHSCKAISVSDKAILISAIPSYPLIKKGEVEVITLSKKRKQDVSGLLKFLKHHKYTLEKRIRKGRTINVLSAKEYARFNKEN